MKSKNSILMGISFAMLLNACTAEYSPSSGISNFRSRTLQNSTFIAVGDLASENSEGTNNEITITKTGRIMATAQIRIDNPGGIAVRGASQLFISDGTGPNNGLTEMGRAATYFSDNNPASQMTVTVVGSAIKEPGTYNIVAKCNQLGVNGKTLGMLDNMVVWVGKSNSIIKSKN